MENERFDRLTRSLVDRATRRGVLGILASVTGLGTGESLASRHRRQRRGQHAPVEQGDAHRKRAKRKPGKGELGADKGHIGGPWRGYCYHNKVRPGECSFSKGDGTGDRWVCCRTTEACCRIAVFGVRGVVPICCATGCKPGGDEGCCPAGTGVCGGLCCPANRCVVVGIGLGPIGVCCAADQVACDSECVDTQTDERHCGSCGRPCAAGETCCSGECVDTGTDERHCGSCGRPCAEGETCLGGGCQSRCLAGLALCSGECVDTQTDERHCGSCGRACLAGETCLGGGCQSRCRTGLVLCAGACVDTGTDPAHCGGCGQACQGGAACQNGVCVAGGAGGACVPYGGSCRTPGECCDGVPCSGGLCRYN